MLHLKISARFNFVNQPKGYLGIRAESWVFGKVPCKPHEILAMVTTKFLEFWSETDGATSEDMKAEITRLQQRLDGLKAMCDMA